MWISCIECCRKRRTWKGLLGKWEESAGFVWHQGVTFLLSAHPVSTNVRLTKFLERAQRAACAWKGKAWMCGDSKGSLGELVLAQLATSPGSDKEAGACFLGAGTAVGKSKAQQLCCGQ